MKKLTACVRGVNPFPKRIYMTCNPGNEGHGWVKRLFIDKKYNEGENPDDYVATTNLGIAYKKLKEIEKAKFYLYKSYQKQHR